MEYKKSKLSLAEATAYWWVNNLKMCIIMNAEMKNTQIFKILKNFDEIKWRQFYLSLKTSIENYLKNNDTLIQSTEINKHKLIIKCLSKICNKKISDSNLSCIAEDNITITEDDKVSIIIKNRNLYILPLEVNSCYIINGDKEELDFYDLLTKTIINIYIKDSHFNSIPILKERFCNEYLKISKNKKNIMNIFEMFERYFDIATNTNKYFSRFSQTDQYLVNDVFYKDVKLTKKSNELADIILGLKQVNILDNNIVIEQLIDFWCKSISENRIERFKINFSNSYLAVDLGIKKAIKEWVLKCNKNNTKNMLIKNLSMRVSAYYYGINNNTFEFYEKYGIHLYDFRCNKKLDMFLKEYIHKNIDKILNDDFYMNNKIYSISISDTNKLYIYESMISSSFVSVIRKIIKSDQNFIYQVKKYIDEQILRLKVDSNNINLILKK